MKKSLYALLLLACIPLVGNTLISYEELSGKGTRLWKQLKTKEDKQNFSLFSEAFQRNFQEKVQDEETETLIPNKIHFIWIGPRPFPEFAKKTVAHWIELCPEFELNFWTDRNRDLIHKDVIVREVNEEILQDMAPFYHATNNIGEKSDVLKMKIIYEEGGVYLDHDILMRKSFAPFHRQYDFYSGLLPTGMGSLDRLPCTRFSIFGAAPKHPILHFALEMTKRKWDEVLALYPGEDETSQHNRTTHRGYQSFHTAVFEAIQDPAFKGIIFPTGYFDEVDGKYGLYSTEIMEGSWKAPRTMHEDALFQKVKRLSKRLTFLALGTAFLLLVNLFFIYRLSKRMRKLKALLSIGAL